MPVLVSASVALVGQAAPIPANCSRKTVRVTPGRHGLVAEETIVVCEANRYIATGQNEVYVRKAAGDLQLVARFDSIGAIGVPLSWQDDTLILHMPTGYRDRTLRSRSSQYRMRVVYDYSDQQQLRDSTH